ncbi:RNA polymerase sigma factor [Pedobacter sp. GR22-6]|uniref:RNA polymerase sigma factor n=1 Tax=Pedobacter sp. GR22-6 TaxID=3127957 RepID=UPI00307CFD76
MHTILSEEELVAVLKTGASKGLGILYQMYSRALLNVVLQVIKDRAIAEDTLQLVWLKVWSEGRNYDPGKGRVYTWLLNIARNTAIDTYRSQAYRVFSRSMCLGDHPECLEQFKSRGLNIDAIGLREIVAKLEEKQREVLELVYFQGYTHLEAAAQLAIPLGTIKTRLRKATAHLRSYFDEDRLRTVRRKITKAQRRLQSSSYRSLAEISLAMELPNEAPKLKRRAGRPKNPVARPKKLITRTKNPIVRTTKPKKESMRSEVIRL